MKGKRVRIRAYKVTTLREVIGEYDSYAEAGASLDLEPTDVGKVIRGERTRVRDYTFEKI